MATRKNPLPELKPQEPETVNEVLQKYSQMSEHDKGVFLQRAGVFYLHHRFRPLSPTPELRGIISNLSRLSFLINTMMRWASIRRIDVDELTVISKSRMDRDIVQPVIKTIQNHCREIEAALFEDSDDGSSKDGTSEKFPETESETRESDQNEVSNESDSQTDDNVFGLNSADEN